MVFILSQAGDKVVYTSPQVNFNNRLTPVSYLKQNDVYRFDTTLIANLAATVMFVDADNPEPIDSAIVYTVALQHETPLRTNYEVEQQVFVEGRTTIPETVTGYQITNSDWLTAAAVIDTSTAVEDYTSYNGGETSSSMQGGAGSYYMNGNIAYSYKKTQNQAYTNFLILPYQYIHFNPVYGPGTSEFYGGDTLIICNQLFRLTSFTENPTLAGFTLWETVLMDMLWCESDLATMLRYEGIDPVFTYFSDGDSDLQVMLKFYTENGSGELSYRTDSQLREYYKLNVDYNLQDNEQAKISLASDYDYCSSCAGLFTNRIVFSPVSFDEENIDTYRSTLVNDYIDMPGHRGAITGLAYRNNRLVVHCEDATFILQPNPQVIATDQSQAYLTTGDFLSIPPQELIQTDIGYAGCQNKQHQADSPRGHHWLDQRRGQVFSYDNNLEEISMVGLSQWFKENLPSETQKAVWTYNHEKYPFRNTTSDFGVGCIMYYDPRFKRLIISKTDYLPIGQVMAPVSGLYWNSDINLWQVYNSSGVVILTPVFSNYERF